MAPWMMQAAASHSHGKFPLREMLANELNAKLSWQARGPLSFRSHAKGNVQERSRGTRTPIRPLQHRSPKPYEH